MRLFSSRAGIGLATMMSSIVLLTATQTMGAPPKDAHPAKDSKEGRAEQAYQQSRELYKDGQYRAAIAKLQEARALDPSAKELPYNLGTVYEKLGELDEAIKYFELYLTLETDDDEKERVRSIVRRLTGARNDRNASDAAASASASAAPAPSPADSAEAPPPAPAAKGRLDAVVMGVGAGALVAAGLGTYLGIHALSSKPSSPSTSRTTSITELQSQADSAHTSAIGSDVSFAIALLAGGVAAFLYFSRDAEPSTAPAAAIVPLPGGAAGHFQVSF